MGRRTAITVGSVIATPVYINGDLSHWNLTDGSVVPADLFEREGQRMLEARTAGRVWSPLPSLSSVNGRLVNPDDARKHLRKVFADGRDLNYEIDAATRDAAVAELERGGQFCDVTDAIPVEQWPMMARELFGRLHGDPLPLPGVADCDVWARELHEAAEKSEQWSKLRDLAAGDAWAAGIGAGVVGRKLLDEFGDMLRKLPQDDPEKLKQQLDAAKEVVPKKHWKKLVPFEQAASQAQDAACEVADAVVPTKVEAAIDASAKQAVQEISESLSAVTALGWGDEPGHLSRVTGPRDEILSALRNNPELRRIAALAGRLKVAAQVAQKSKVRYVPEQIVDVTLGGEVSRLLPSELVLLAAEETELLELRRLVERQAMEYSLEGTEKKNRGPLILCVDESGSMVGPRHEMACALALALLEVCAMQRRSFAYLHFDTRVTREWLVERPVAIPFADLLAEVSHFSGGGTNFSPPLARAVQMVKNVPGLVDADVMLLTDGVAGWTDEPRGLANLGARLWGIEIGGQFSADQRKAMAGIVTLEPNLAGATGKFEVVLGV